MLHCPLHDVTSHGIRMLNIASYLEAVENNSCRSVRSLLW